MLLTALLVMTSTWIGCRVELLKEIKTSGDFTVEPIEHQLVNKGNQGLASGWAGQLYAKQQQLQQQPGNGRRECQEKKPKLQSPFAAARTCQRQQIHPKILALSGTTHTSDMMMQNTPTGACSAHDETQVLK